MSTEHLTAEDRWFATHWEACGQIIAEALAEGRQLGPYAIATIETLTAETKASGWLMTDPVEDDDRGLTVSVRTAVPLTNITVTGNVGAEPNRRERMAELAGALVEIERGLFVDKLAPKTSTPWSTTGQLPIDHLLTSLENHDVLLNMESTGGAILAMLTETFIEHLGGQVIQCRLGVGTPHLFVPQGAVTVHEAGVARHRRPTAGLLRIDTAVGLSCADPEAVVALDADPS